MNAWRLWDLVKGFRQEEARLVELESAARAAGLDWNVALVRKLKAIESGMLDARNSGEGGERN